MWAYFIRRLIILIPTLLVVIILGFYIQALQPTPTLSFNEDQKESSKYEQAQETFIKAHNLQLPYFYISINSFENPDTIFKIINPNIQKLLITWLDQIKNWEAVSTYYHELKQISIADSSPSIRHLAKLLLTEPQIDHHSSIVLETKATGKINNALNKLKLASWNFAFFIPRINFTIENQFHLWLFGNDEKDGVLKGNFGNSIYTNQPITQNLLSGFKYTLIFTCLSIILSMALAIVIATIWKWNPKLDALISTFTIAALCAPSYWVGSILLTTFSNPELLNIFPASGIQPIFSSSNGVPVHFIYFILPLVCYCYGLTAMLVNLLIQHLKTNENKAYYYTAKYKGIGKSKLYFFHQLPNALLPALSYLVQSIPALLSGSVVIELIFTIPGMGFSIFNAIQQGDHVAISFIFLLMGTITLVSFLLADVIAKWFNPKNEAIW
ncbi:MAG: hypothetical protein RIQ89_701 [Bacteroidota bacterium]|jgi:peptide/nickel transport system permease protein